MYSYLVGSHIVLALVAIGLGTLVLVMTKGTSTHKLMGRIWVLIMTLVAVGSFAIRDLNSGELSWIHGLSTFTLIAMGYSILMIRKGRRSAHFMAMIGCFVGLVIAGIFTLSPDRLLGRFLFGT